MARILFLEPFGGGSHQTLYRGWQKYSKHEIKVLELPAIHWKWRSRHASFTLAEKAEKAHKEDDIDLVVASSMLNLPEWRGFLTGSLQHVPSVVYFHENQFTYPLSPGQRRDYHFGYSNVLSVMAANQAWFNSEFHRQDFWKAAVSWLRRMPDFSHIQDFNIAMEESLVMPPGIDPPSEVEQRADDSNTGEPPVIGWVARWEHDKGPDVFVETILQLMEQFDFRLVLLSQGYEKRPESIGKLVDMAEDRLLHCGFAESREEYWHWLGKIDIVVSTASHEFFGLSMLEAMHAGAYPMLPNRLAYPNLLAALSLDTKVHLYDSNEQLHCRLANLLETQRVRERVGECNSKQFLWSKLAAQFDSRAERLL